ncbi:MAG: tetratricopeptide repeat protein [Deltaproteobacteria bacterium]|nr:tetratricopeptide repeat protein [Deltaproteobacteria bacterium]
MLQATYRSVALVCCVLALSGFELLRSENSDVVRGNREMAAKKYEQALAAYEAAQKDLPQDDGVAYNRGVALYKLGRWDDAAKALSQASRSADDSLRQRAFYNLGNVQFQKKAYADAAASYQQALRLNPADAAAKWNLELALRELEKEEKKKKQDQQKQDQQKQDQQKQDQQKQDQQKQDQQKQDQQKQDQQKQDQQKQDQQKQDQQKQDQQKQDQQKQDQQKQGQQKQDQQKQDQQKQDQQKQGQQKQQQPQKALPQGLKQTLDALDRNDRDLQKRRLLMRHRGQRRPPRQDW